jgi:hypothetical protein
MVLACTRNWVFSKCAYLVPGTEFPFEYQNGQIRVTGNSGRKGKERTLKLDIVSSQPKN